MSGRAGIPARWAYWGLGGVVFLAGLALWQPFPAGIWHDDGVYMMLGRALAEGEGLRYLGVADAPPAPKFPPLYPLALAGVWSFAGEVGRAVVGARLLNLLFLAGAAGLFARYLHRDLELELAEAAGIAGLAWLSVGLWRVALLPLSEPLFVLALVAGLVAATRMEGEEEGGLVPPVLFILAFALSAYVRTAGVALLAAGVLALLLQGRRRLSLAVAGGGAAVLLPWVLWSSRATREIPEPLRDVLGPYGGWLAEQIVASPGEFFGSLHGEALDLVYRVLTVLLPRAPAGEAWLGDLRWATLLLFVPAFLLGVDRVWKRSRTPVLLVLAYVALIWVWPFRGDRLLVPVAPLLVLLVAQGFLWRGEGTGGVPGSDEIEDAKAPAWVGRSWRGVGAAWALVFAGLSAWSLLAGGHLSGYEVRSRALVRAAEAVEGTVPADAVVGAPELWAGLHLHTGRTVAPSARFRPLDPDAPSWGTPEEQLELWAVAGIDHLLVEHGGKVHRAALDALEARCGDGSRVVLASWEGAALVRLRWSPGCRRAIGGEPGR